MEAAHAEVQGLSRRAELPADHLATALHKCGVFAQAFGILEQAEVGGP